MKKIAVVLCSFNRGKDIIPTIRSLQKQSVPPSKIIVIDDGSDTGRKVPSLHSKQITQIFLTKNRGVVWGRNLGLSLCKKFDFVLVVDDDITLEQDCIESLLTAFQNNADCVAAMPVVYFRKNKKRVWSAGSGVNLLTGQTIFYTQKPSKSFVEIPAATSVLLVRMTEIVSKGWYDPLYYFCYEDADFYYRLRRNSKKIYVVRNATAWHDIPLDLSLERVARRSYHIARGRVLFLSRHSQYFPLNLVCVAVYILYYGYLGIRYSHPLASFRFLQGFFDGLFLYLSGSAKEGGSLKYREQLIEPEMHNPTRLKSAKVRE